MSQSTDHNLNIQSTDDASISNENILDQYIDLDDVSDKFDIHIETLKKYLGKSGVEVIQLSTQKLLIHETELEKFMNFYKTILENR